MSYSDVASRHSPLTRSRQIDAFKKAAAESKSDDSPRIFALHKCVSRVISSYIFLADTQCRNFYQMRINRIRSMEIARRNAERLKNPTSFPSVPSGDL
jgi:hypothetical protein